MVDGMRAFLLCVCLFDFFKFLHIFVICIGSDTGNFAVRVFLIFYLFIFHPFICDGLDADVCAARLLGLFCSYCRSLVVY